MKAIVVGPDRDLARELEARGADVARLDLGTGAGLGAAGVEGADLLVVTDVGEATSIPIAKDVNPDIRVVIYAPESMPEFVRGQADLAVAPGVLDPAVVAEELVGDGASPGGGNG